MSAGLGGLSERQRRPLGTQHLDLPALRKEAAPARMGLVA